MTSRDRIYVAGHNGMVGSALVRKLRAAGFDHLLLPSRSELDLTVQAQVADFFRIEQPEYVFLAAARVGGILANTTYPAEFIADNLAIELNVIRAAHEYGAERLVFMSTSCAYPKHAPQPMREEHLLTSVLEPTNEPYAVAKIAGIKLCEAFHRQYGDCFFSLMPTNLYGPNDNFDLQTAHVLPALLRKFHEAKLSGARTVEVWGTGTARREFMHVDDLADAALHLLPRLQGGELINVGTGIDLSIRELALLISEVVGHEGTIVWDPTKPDGTPRKLLDVSRQRTLGWEPRIELRAGIASVYEWYQSQMVTASA
jgi:GDP-L-fucose synthase